MAKGYTVRACVRNATDHAKVAHLRAMNTIENCAGTLELFEADLTVSGSYDAAFNGATCVFHGDFILSLMTLYQTR